MKPIVYHNPRCSKSRETVKLLESQSIDFDTRLYLQDTPTPDDIQQLLTLLGFASARELMRTKESIYKELHLADVTDENTLIITMSEHPKLIERPIVIVNNTAKIGRPPEAVLELFQ